MTDLLDEVIQELIDELDCMVDDTYQTPPSCLVTEDESNFMLGFDETSIIPMIEFIKSKAKRRGTVTDTSLKTVKDKTQFFYELIFTYTDNNELEFDLYPEFYDYYTREV